MLTTAGLTCLKTRTAAPFLSSRVFRQETDEIPETLTTANITEVKGKRKKCLKNLLTASYLF
jgi:hypothetical protein